MSIDATVEYDQAYGLTIVARDKASVDLLRHGLDNTDLMWLERGDGAFVVYTRRPNDLLVGLLGLGPVGNAAGSTMKEEG